jgi:hypothetical protein
MEGSLGTVVEFEYIIIYEDMLVGLGVGYMGGAALQGSILEGSCIQYVMYSH